MIHSNQHIVELDISFAKLTLQNFYYLTQALYEKEIENLQIVSLKGINKLFLTETEIKMHNEFIDEYMAERKGAIEKITPESLYGGEQRITN